jgi:predicted XRE-type DNA-binding protein
VSADLNLPHADDLLAKAELTAKIIAEIQWQRLTQNQAAAMFGIDPKVLALKQGGLSGFSIERRKRLPVRLGRDVEITVKRRSGSGSVPGSEQRDHPLGSGCPPFWHRVWQGGRPREETVKFMQSAYRPAAPSVVKIAKRHFLGMLSEGRRHTGNPGKQDRG